jgi:hypothetical protein
MRPHIHIPRIIAHRRSWQSIVDPSHGRASAVPRLRAPPLRRTISTSDQHPRPPAPPYPRLRPSGHTTRTLTVYGQAPSYSHLCPEHSHAGVYPQTPPPSLTEHDRLWYSLSPVEKTADSPRGLRPVAAPLLTATRGRVKARESERTANALTSGWRKKAPDIPAGMTRRKYARCVHTFPWTRREGVSRAERDANRGGTAGFRASSPCSVRT